MSYLTKYVISLRSAQDRRKHISNEFFSKNITFNFFDAIEPKQMNEVAKQYAIQIDNSGLSNGEICCLLSHVCLWGKMIESKISHIAIFEDDIYLGKSADNFLVNTDWIDAHWDILRLEKAADVTAMALSKTPVSDNRVVGRLITFSGGTAGYILSIKAAKSLLKYMQGLKKIDHVDQIMFKDYLKYGEFPVYQMNPALCVQDNVLHPNSVQFVSSLNWNNTEKRKINMSQKIIREIIRPIKQLYLLPFKCEIKFK